MLTGSEEFALIKEKELEEWQNNVGVLIPGHICRIDTLLENGLCGLNELASLFSDKEWFEPFKSVEEFAVVHELVKIFELEKSAFGEKYDESFPCIFRNIKSVEDGLALVNEYKWLLFRIDFGTEEEIWGNEETDTCEALRMVDFITGNNLSIYAINILTDNLGMRKPVVYYKIWQITSAAGMDALAAGILSLLNGKWPGNIEASVALGNMYMDISEEQAVKYLSFVPDFLWDMDEDTQKRVLLLSNEMWFFKYDNGNSGEILMEMIQESLGMDGKKAYLSRECLAEMIRKIGLENRIAL